MMFKFLLHLAVFVVSVSCANFRRTTCSDGSVVTNSACCVFTALRDDLLENLFGGVCGEEVHESLRLAFHDAVGISKSQGPSAGGGADGSPIVFPNVEANFPANLGISDSIEFLSPFLTRHNVTAGDLIQFAAAVGITICPGAPQIQFLAGRPTAIAPSVIGLVPEPQDTLDSILARFEDSLGTNAAQSAALLVSHTIGRSDHIIPGFQAVPFDTTPFVFDSQFFVEVQLRGTAFPGDGEDNLGEVMSSGPLTMTSGENVGELRLQSDHQFARDSRTSCTFQSFVNNHQLMIDSFSASMAIMAVAGQDVSNLIDCSDVIPSPLPAVSKPPTFPAGVSQSDVEQACATAAFPTLATDPGPATLIPHCPPQQGGDADDCDSDEGSLKKKRWVGPYARLV